MTALPHTTMVPIITAVGPFYDEVIAQIGGTPDPEKLAENLVAYDGGTNSDMFAYLLDAYTTRREIERYGHTLTDVTVDGTEYLIETAPEVPACALYRALALSS